MKAGQAATATANNDHLYSTAQLAEPRERTPWLLGFLCILIPILPSYSVLPGPLKSNGSPARLIAVMFFGLAVLGFVLIRRTARTQTVRPGVLVILLFFLLQLAIYGVGVMHLDSTLAEASKTRSMIVVFANVGVAIYIMARVETARQRNIVLGCLAIGLTYACVVGLLQVTGVDLRYFFQPPGFVVNAEDVSLAERFGAKRVLGTSPHAIEFSVLAAVTVPLTIHFARYAASWQVRWLAMLACGLALVAMPAAVSRSGLVTLVAALVVYMWSFNVRRLAVGVVAGCLAVGTYILAFRGTAIALWNTVINSEEDVSVLTRTADYAVVSKTFRAHPLFGLGLGNSEPTEYGFLDNQWLQAIVQGGMVGVTAMVVLAGGGIFGIAAALRGATTPCERDQAYMLGSMFVAILASSFTFDLFAYQQATLILFITFGLLWSNFTVSSSGARTTPTGSTSTRPEHGL